MFRLTVGLFTAFCCVLPAIRPAHGQAFVYAVGKYNVFGYSPTGTSDDQPYTYRHEAFGGGGGFTWLFRSHAVARSGLDARFTAASGRNGGQTGSLSYRLAIVPRTNPFRPYLQTGIGFVRSIFTDSGISQAGVPYSSQRHIGGVTSEFAFGLDVRLSPSIELRPFEIEGNLSSKTGALGVSAGILFRLPGLRHPTPPT